MISKYVSIIVVKFTMIYKLSISKILIKPLIIYTIKWLDLNEPRCEKTGLRGFRPGPTQTGLYNHTRWLEA